MHSGSKPSLSLPLLCALAPPALAGEWSGHAGVEALTFPEAALHAGQHDASLSIAAQAEYHHRWDSGRRSFTLAPFARFDPYDGERTHADIRELTWLKAAPAHEWRIGVRKVFWGVTESQHLVDIINQTDAVENPDGEEKLGQPMINLALIRDWGTLDVFALTGFRERTFPGAEGRPRLAVPVDADQARYESKRAWRRIDGALRYRHTLGAWDFGLSYFSGTSRDPRLVPERNGGGQVILIPHYDLIAQTGLDAQATLGGWLWKLEAIHRRGAHPAYSAATAGFEYTFTGAFGTGADLGLLAEYLYDDRGRNAPVPFQNDVMAGFRVAANDVQSTELLAGMIYDTARHTRLYTLEGSRRIGDRWKISLEGRVYSHVPADDGALYGFRNDSHVRIELTRYFQSG